MTPMPRTMAILWPIFTIPTLTMPGAGISRGYNTTSSTLITFLMLCTLSESSLPPKAWSTLDAVTLVSVKPGGSQARAARSSSDVPVPVPQNPSRPDSRHPPGLLSALASLATHTRLRVVRHLLRLDLFCPRLALPARLVHQAARQSRNRQSARALQRATARIKFASNAA